MADMTDDQAREMRPETTSEHIARDMREGRFPEQSERQMVPVLASLPDEIQVWRSTDTLDHIGTWATTRFPAEAVSYVPKADAQAAVALVVEQAAAFLDGHAAVCRGQVNPMSEHSDPPLTKETAAIVAGKNAKLRHDANRFEVIAAAIRALAPADALAAVEALRKERDALKADRDQWQEEVGKCIMACRPGPEGFRTSPASAGVYKMRQALDAAIADRDRLSAANAALEAKLARLVETARPFADVADLFDSEVKGVGASDTLSLWLNGDNEDPAWRAMDFKLGDFGVLAAALADTDGLAATEEGK